MRYRFKIARKQFKVGDLVPESYSAGVIQTMLDYHQIEPVPALVVLTTAPIAKAIENAPADKSMRRDRVQRKTVTA